MHAKPLTTLSLTVTALVLIAGCSSSGTAADGSGKSASTATSVPASSSATGSAPSATGSAPSGTVTVLAAASLTGTFTKLAKAFEASHPGVTVKLSFGASSALALQINQGAPADVFASASVKNMTQIAGVLASAHPTNFVKNVMEIAVPPANPAKITGVADLAKSGVKVALCQVQVPCGSTAQAVFKNAKVVVKPVSLEADVKSTLAKVELGEVDAGVVYVTDVQAAGGKVVGIPIPTAVNASTEYPIVALSKAPNPPAAQAFVDYVLSAAGQSVFAAAGFEKP